MAKVLMLRVEQAATGCALMLAERWAMFAMKDGRWLERKVKEREKAMTRV
jgi:hypothetical protein